MDDFVRDKLIQWGLKEWIGTFKKQAIDAESLACLEDEDIDKLIPIIGPRSRFKKRLKLFKEQNANQEDDHAHSQQKQEESAAKSQRPKQLKETEPLQVLSSTSHKDVKTEKRKLNLQGESSRGTPPPKRRRETKSSSAEAMVLSDVKNIMMYVHTKLNSKGITKLNDFLKTKIRELEMDKRELVGVFGKTGAGKTALINAVIGIKNLLPSGSVDACTSVMIKVESNMHNSKFKAEIQFITKEEWEDELGSGDQLLRDNADQDEDEDDENDEYHDMVEKLSAVYGEEWKEKHISQLMDNKYFREIPEFPQSKRKIFTCETAEELSAKIIKYTRNDTYQEGGKDVKRWYWPLVKCVTVRVPKNTFLQHVTLVDLPGNGDRNKSRDTMWKGIVGNCSAVWIVTEINRAASETESWEILKSVSSLIGNGGECQQIHFICTKSDVTDDHSAADVQSIILKRNVKAKKGVRKEFNKLTKIRKHFSDDCFQVFTVSSKEFLKRKHLNPENTEIPKLQVFLQDLNDCHSETLNYVSGAQGILSLIQGASLSHGTVKSEDVCKDLERNLTIQLDSVRKVMKDVFTAFTNSINDGIKKSKRSCGKHLKSFLYPVRKTGSAYHHTLKSVVKNGGVYKPKNGKEIDFNKKLTSGLTDSIDEEFRKTFPNEAKCSPFNGVINKFSLDTDTLKEKYTCVDLQLIFLKTEEEKLKIKLSKTIRDSKKLIYASLTKTTQGAMKECYERAATFRGKNTLQNIRDTVKRHVHKSKNTMFKEAADVMLEQLRTLMCEILKTLEKSMKESIELALRTDHHSIPDVSAELALVNELFCQLKGSSGE